MNENYNPIYEEGKSISVSGLCMYLLKKWKVMLIAGLVAAIVLGGLSYVDSNKKYKQAQNTATSSQQPGVSISEYDKEVVLAKKQYIESHEVVVKEYDYYYTNSIKVRLSPNAVQEGIAAYVIDGADLDALFQTAAVCEGVLFSEEAYAELAGMLSEETDISMLKEVITFEKGYRMERGDEVTTNMEGDSELKIVVRHFNEADCKVMLDFVEEKMETLPQLLAERNINAKVTKGSVGYGVVVDRSLAPLKKELQMAKLSAYEAISNTKNNMSDDQKAYYEYLLKQEAGEEIPQSTVAVAKPKLDLLMVILGAVAGVAVAAVAFVAQYLFGGHVHNKEELKSWLAVPVLGAEDGVEMLAANLEAITSKNQAAKICLTGNADQNGELASQLKALLSKKGIETVVVNSILKDAKAMETAADCGSVVLMEKCDVSKEKDVREMVLKASSCGMNVLGVVLEK